MGLVQDLRDAIAGEDRAELEAVLARVDALERSTEIAGPPRPPFQPATYDAIGLQKPCSGCHGVVMCAFLGKCMGIDKTTK